MIKKNDFKTIAEILRENKVGNLELLYMTSALRKAIKDPDVKIDEVFTEFRKKMTKK